MPIILCIFHGAYELQAEDEKGFVKISSPGTGKLL
jgi:hypothetical protein